MRTLRTIEADELRSLAVGTGILGTGGGTHPYLELLNAEKLYRDGYQVQLLDPADLGDDELVAEIGFMGAPLITKERLPDPEHACRPLRLMEQHAGIRFAAVMASEIGAENGVLPLLVAALTGLPVVDADTMGRAFPEMQMSSFVIHGLPLTPFALCDIRDNDLLMTEAEGPYWVERIGRKACTEMGSIATTCRPPRPGRVIKEFAVHHTVSRSIRLGAAVRRAREHHEDPVETILAAERGIALFRGKVIDVARRTTAGFVRGVATIEGHDGFAGQRLEVDFDRRHAILGRRVRLGQHQGDELPGEDRLISGNRRFRAVLADASRQVMRGQHLHHAGNLQRGGGVNAADSGVRVRAGDRAGDEHPRDPQVTRESFLSRQALRGILPPYALANGAQFGHGPSSFLPQGAAAGGRRLIMF